MMLFVIYFAFFVHLTAGSYLNSSPSETATIVVSGTHRTTLIDSSHTIEQRDEQDLTQHLASMTPDTSLPSFGSITEETAQPQIVTLWATPSAAPPGTLPPSPHNQFVHQSNGSSMILAIVVTIIGGALLLTFVGWLWRRKMNNKKEFGDSSRDTEMGKYGLFDTSGAPGGASRHYTEGPKGKYWAPRHPSATYQYTLYR